MSQFSKSSIPSSKGNNIVSFAEDESYLLDHEPQMDNISDGHYVVETNEVDDRPRLIPGSNALVGYLDHEMENDLREPPARKNWQEDRAAEGFMDYAKDSYPNKIPKHDGKSMVGAERAIKWLTNFGKEISEAVRKDDSGVLDDSILEEMRVSVMKDILLLKEHVKKLDKAFKGKLKKKAGLDGDIMKYAEEIEIAYNHEINGEIRKIAAHPKIQLVVSPFERAISGIIINSVVSGGKPLEEVYDFLKEKYELTDREELAVMQVIMDSGYPIFKDRGTFSSKKGKDSGKMHGIEFIKNYFS
jgi:hypothetical protein